MTLWPVEWAYAGFASTTQFDFDAATNVATVLRLRLQCQSGTFPALALQRLRFYLHGERAMVNALYELLCCHVLRIAMPPDNSTRPVFLPEDALVPALVWTKRRRPIRPTLHPGYRLLQEYFTFPEKFWFDLAHLAPQVAQTTCDILILLDQIPQERHG